MKIKIKFEANYKETKDGFPIYLIVSSKKNRKKRCVGHSKLKDWNTLTNKPQKSHYNYTKISRLLFDVNHKINTEDFTNLNISEILNLILNEKQKSNKFYIQGLELIKENSTGKLNKTILNSFNRFCIDIDTDQITPEIVEDYKIHLLEKNSPNGVHTYLRKLSTIFKKVSKEKNPFQGIRPKKKPTKSKALNLNDLKKLIYTRSLLKINDTKNNINTVNYPRFYWLLMFYLGGIDFIDLANLRYDLHVIDGRIQFNRFKGQTEVFVNNKIFPEAKKILKLFDCKPYLIPAYKCKDYKSYIDRVNTNLHDRTKDLNLSKKPLTKSARYTFITRAQQLLIDERITVEIVGHTQQKIHSIYTDEFPLSVRDNAHKKIITIC